MAKTKSPVEELILHASQDLSEGAYESFISGRVSQPELVEFYDALKGWTTVSEKIIAEADRLGIKT